MQEYSAEIEPQKMSLDDFQAAKELIDHSAEYYRCEDSRLRKISPHLSHFLGKNITWGGKLNSGHKEWAPDGHIMIYCPLCEDEALLPISLHIEIKNAPGDTDPVEQAQHDAFSLYTAPAVCALSYLCNKPSDLMYRWRSSAHSHVCLASFLGS